jgi:hypothetical protein
MIITIHVCMYMCILKTSPMGFSLITLLTCGGKETDIKENPLLFLNCETHFNLMVLPSPSQNTMSWFKALNIPYSQHNLHIHDDKWWDHKNSNEGEKTLYFDKERIFFIISQDPIVGNGQKLGMLSCEHVSVNTNKWTQVNFFRNIPLTSMDFFLTHGMEYSMM